MHEGIDLIIARDLDECSVDDGLNQTSDQDIHFFEIMPLHTEHPNGIARIDSLCCSGKEDAKPRPG
jgi:hypothetical protein